MTDLFFIFEGSFAYFSYSFERVWSKKSLL